MIFPLLLVGFLICRFVIFVPKNYWKAPPECSNPQTFDYDRPGTIHLSTLHEELKSKSPEDYRYFFKTFLEEDKIYMVVNFRNEQECFDVKMLVDKWDKLAGMRWANGKSYPKELHDLEWTVKNNEITYVDMHDIIELRAGTSVKQ